MATMLEIINLGFARINIRRIVSLAEQSKESRIAGTVWDTCRDAALRSHPWGFAMRRERLAKLEGKPPGKQFAYLPPSDMLAARKVLPSDDIGQNERTAPFEMGFFGGRPAVLTDIEDAWIEYTARVENCSFYPPDFVDALSYRLAADFATSLKSDYEAASGMLRLAEASGRQGVLSDADESVFQADRISSFELARHA